MENKSFKLREIILNTRKPIVLRDFKTNWKCFDGNLENWCSLFDKAQKGAQTEFEQKDINLKNGNSQFGAKRKVEMTMKEFLELHKDQNQTFWTGFNYKTPNDMPMESKEGVDFSLFGFPHIFHEYSRFWISSKGAYTSCHQDTYGCNIVVQVYGRLVTNRDGEAVTSLRTTRLPYEESSIYCMENFYAPSSEQINELLRFKDEAYICELKADDILIVPRHWWHFVEATELSLSVNAWVPLDKDAEARLEECIVAYLIKALVRVDECDYVPKYLIDSIEKDAYPGEMLLILAHLSKSFDEPGDVKKIKPNEISYDYQYLEEEKVEDLLKEFPNCTFIEKANLVEYEQLLECNAKRFVKSAEESKNVSMSLLKEAFMNSVCSKSVVQSIIREFKRRYPEKTFQL